MLQKLKKQPTPLFLLNQVFWNLEKSNLMRYYSSRILKHAMHWLNMRYDIKKTWYQLIINEWNVYTCKDQALSMLHCFDWYNKSRAICAVRAGVYTCICKKKNWGGGVHKAHLVFSALSYPHVWLICQMSLDVVFCPRQPVSTYPWSDPLPFGESSLVLPRPLLQTVQRFSGISLSLSQLVRTSFSLNRRFLSLSAIAWPPIPL